MDISALLWPNHSSINIFGLQIYWYAIIIVFGMIAAFFVITLLFKRRNMSTDLFLTFFVVCLPIAILTTRLFYCITDGMHISEWFSFKSIREGGLSIIGGIIGGTISVFAVCKIKKVNFFRVGDCVVVGLLLAQSIGRWGNFVNQEVYGSVVSNPALQFFPFSVYIEADGAWHYAFFFYESLVTFAGAVLLFINAWKNGKKPNGVNSACYFIIYGLTRSIMEPLRDSEYILGNGVPWSMVMSIVMFVAGCVWLAFLLWFNKENEGSIFGSKKGDPYGITKFYGDTKTEIAYRNNINMMCAIYPENYPEKPIEGQSKKEITTQETMEEEPITEEEDHTQEKEE